MGDVDSNDPYVINAVKFALEVFSQPLDATFEITSAKQSLGIQNKVKYEIST